MYIPSTLQRDEFLAVPELVRAVLSDDGGKKSPLLLFKASTLVLKYVYSLSKFQLVVFKDSINHIVYGIRVMDDPVKPMFNWSLVESPEELQCLKAISEGNETTFHMFNEGAANVTWAKFSLGNPSKVFSAILDDGTQAITSAIDDRYIRLVITQIQANKHDTNQVYVSETITTSAWKDIKSFYVANNLESGVISLFEDDEGGQQEHLCQWLVDGLESSNVTKSPEFQKGGQKKELTDLLIHDNKNSILIESKSLAVMTRPKIPNRTKLSQNLVRHLDKARSQLKGAIRSIGTDRKIFRPDGDGLIINRNTEPHAIILIPDLGLIHGNTDYGGQYLTEFQKVGGKLQILDPIELLRVLQATKMIFEQQLNSSMLDCLHYYLNRRYERLLDQEHADLDFLIRIHD